MCTYAVFEAFLLLLLDRLCVAEITPYGQNLGVFCFQYTP
jgi:hypothetical protein